MYCKSCGYQLDSRAASCAHCGAPVSGLEACGGFWGLVGEPERPAVVPVVAVIPDPVSSPARPEETGSAPDNEAAGRRTRQTERTTAQFPTLIKLLLALCGLLLILVLVLTAALLGGKAERSAQDASSARLEAELEESARNAEALRQENDALAGENRRLEQELNEALREKAQAEDALALTLEEEAEPEEDGALAMNEPEADQTESGQTAGVHLPSDAEGEEETAVIAPMGQ